MIQVNLMTLTALTKRLLPGMLKRGFGRIMNISSVGAFAPSPYNAIYSATKAYVLSFSEAIAEELAGTPVTVTCVCPGPTKSELQKRGDMDDVKLMQRGVMETEPVARAAYHAMMDGKRVVVPGISNKIQVFLTRFAPRTLITRYAKAALERAE